MVSLNCLFLLYLVLLDLVYAALNHSSFLRCLGKGCCMLQYSYGVRIAL